MIDTPLNLDKLAAERAQEMVKEVQHPNKVKEVKQPIETLERLATKALGVLQEQGVYAMMLFLFSRTSKEEKRVAQVIRAQLFKALEALPIFHEDGQVPAENTDPRTALQFYTDKVVDDLDTLLLVRDLYEQTLIYARYGAKACQVRGEKSELARV